MFKSHALWTKINESTDTHDTKSQAINVCSTMMMDYNLYEPCSVRGMCLEVWVTDENNEVVHEEKRSKLYLLRISVGSCNCLTKTNEAKFHDDNCSYKRISNSIKGLEK